MLTVKNKLLCFVCFFPLAGFASGKIALDSPWKEKVYAFTEKELKHSAWGLAHSKRDYLVAKDLADAEGMDIDEEVLFAAAFLHDMGGFPKYEKKGVDHAVRSAELVASVLEPLGFPVAKIEAVKKAIVTHSYYCPDKPLTPEAVVLHDADALDFLGLISVARIISITERETPSLAKSISLVRRLLNDVPKSLITETAKKRGVPRMVEMKDFLARIKAESFGNTVL